MKFPTLDFYISIYLKHNVESVYRNFISRFHHTLENQEFSDSDLFYVFMHFQRNGETININEYNKEETFRIYLKFKREKFVEELMSLDKNSVELASNVTILNNIINNYDVKIFDLQNVIKEDINEIRRILNSFSNNLPSLEVMRDLKTSPLLQLNVDDKDFIQYLYNFLTNDRVLFLLYEEVSISDFKMLFEVNPKSMDLKINIQKNNSFVILLLDTLEPYIPDFNIKYFTSIGVFYNKKGKKITSEGLYTARCRIKSNNSKGFLKFKNDLNEFLKDNI